MKFRLVLGLVVMAVALTAPSTVQAQFFFDDFDSYSNGSGLIGQGGWEGWNNDPTWDTFVTNQEAYTSPHSIFAAPPMDVVQIFSGVDSGVWYAKAFVYIPSNMNGDLFFILLNTYAHNGTQNWSTQIVFCAQNCGDNGIPNSVLNLGTPGVPAGDIATLVTDQWAEIVVEIDLDDGPFGTYNVYYDGDLMNTGGPIQWQSDGIVEIQAIDLFADSNDVAYMDNIWLDQNIPVELMGFEIE
jgi:hypothetical protein